MVSVKLLKVLLYVDMETAKDCGFTHHGTMFGVPAWVGSLPDDEIAATPKVPVTWLWCWLADELYTLATHFMSQEQYLDVPIYFGRPIE